MELKKAFKSLVALGAGATLVGATVLSALAAADLSTYPAPFLSDGSFNSLIIVGASAKTADVLGAVDIATSLQLANTVPVFGATTTTSVEGDAFRIGTGADFLEKGEALNEVGVTTLTSNDLAALAGGSITNAHGTFSYSQTILISAPSTDFTIDPDDSTDIPDWYLGFDSGKVVYTYRLSFTPALISDVDSNNDLDDLDRKSLVLLGTEYTVVDTNCEGTGCTIDLMAGAVNDMLATGETKTYFLGDSEYEVKLLYIDSDNAKFFVNGVSTDKIQVGETGVLDDGTEIGVVDILYQAYAGGVQQVEYYLGATRLRLEDSDITDSATGHKSIRLGSNTVTDVTGLIQGTSGDETKIDYLEFTWTADEDIFLRQGLGLSESAYNDDSQMFLNFDISYEGLQEDANADTIELFSAGDDEYRLRFVNKAGNTLTIPLLDVDDGVATYGNENYALLIGEGDSISRNDYFVVSDSAAKNTFLLRYRSQDASNNILEFESLGSGAELKVSYNFIDEDTRCAYLTLSGVSYDIYCSADENNADLTVDLNADGELDDGDIPYWHTQYGAYILAKAVPLNGLRLYSEGGDDTIGSSEPTDMIKVKFSASGSDIEISEVSGAVALESVGDTNNEEDYSVWGTHVYLNGIESGPDRLTFTYPDDQTEHLVYYSSGDTTLSTSTVGTSEMRSIGVDVAVLDTEVLVYGAQNIIVVGGPCVNAAAAELLGNPADCTEGFTEGTGVLRLFERANGNVALLVAGMTGMDTRRAARALSEYSSHALAGTEMIVYGTSLTEYTLMGAD